MWNVWLLFSSEFLPLERAYRKDGRNVCLHDFYETWPDEGDADMYRLAKVLHQAGYPYMLMPDHAPHHPDDAAPEGASKRMSPAWAFQFEYIIALIQAVENESPKE